MFLHRRQPRQRVRRYHNPTHSLAARAQSDRTRAVALESSLERRKTIPGDAQDRHGHLAIRHLQRVPAGDTWSSRDGRVPSDARRRRLLEWYASAYSSYSV